MSLRGLLLLSLALTGQALGETFPRPAMPLAQAAPRFQTPDESNAEIAQKAPAFGGSYPKEGALYVVVTSPDPLARQAAVRELFAAQGEELRRQGFTPEQVVFVPGQFNAAQLLAAKEIASGIPGGQSIDIDEVRNRVVVELLLPGMETRAGAFLAGQHLPAGIVVLRAAPPGKLQEGPTFAPPHQARLDLPAHVAQGDTLQVELKVSNPAAETLVLEHGACAFRLEVLDARTGEAVLPIPGALICTSELRRTVIPARGTVTLAAEEWDLRRPSGALVTPGRYVVRASFGVGALEQEIIRPPDQTFEVTAGNPASGTAQVRDVLRDGAYGITFQARLGEERGQQVVFVTVPDTRASAAVGRLLRERNLPLTRVRFRVRPPLRVPQGPGQGEAQLKVETFSFPRSTQYDFELQADLAPWLARGAWRCELVVNVLDRKTGEVVEAWPAFDLSPQPHPCSEKGVPLPYPWRASWDGRRLDGATALAGTYEVRAGLRVSLRDGRVIWLLARPTPVTVE